jgi:hypothetical protein
VFLFDYHPVQLKLFSEMGKKDDKKKAKAAAAPPPEPAESFDMVFHVQLAHGSPTRQVRDFTNVKQLYESIAKVHAIETDDVSSLHHTLTCHTTLAPVA